MSDLSTPDKEQNDTCQSRRCRDKNFRVNLGRKLVTLRFKSSLQCSNKLVGSFTHRISVCSINSHISGDHFEY